MTLPVGDLAADMSCVPVFAAERFCAYGDLHAGVLGSDLPAAERFCACGNLGSAVLGTERLRSGVIPPTLDMQKLATLIHRNDTVVKILVSPSGRGI